MQKIWIIINSAGILLGIYRERQLADRAIEVYDREDSDGSPMLYLYEVCSNEINKFAANKFKVVSMTDLTKF